MSSAATAIEVVPVAGALGAEIRGVDLRALDDDIFSSVHAALLEHEVIFFRGAHLTEDEQIELGRWFGQPTTSPMSRLFGITEPTLQTITDGPDSPNEADYWHTDITWTAEPPAYALLCGIEMPERGGDTLWASMTAAYDALSPAMQERLARLRVVHNNESFIGGVVRKLGQTALDQGLPEKLREHYPPVEHPLVRTHPETGRRALVFGGRFMRSIVGMTDAESAMVFDFLLHHIESPRFQCRWNWQVGDLAIWDERSTAHRAANDHFPQVRSIRRLEIAGTRPVL